MAQNRKGSGPLTNVTNRIMHVKARFFLFFVLFAIYELVESKE